MAKKKETRNAATWKRVERKLRPFWFPMDKAGDVPESAVRSLSVFGVVKNIRERVGKFGPQRYLDLDTDDGNGLTVPVNGNLGYLLADGAIGEGMLVRIDYIGFSASTEDLPMGRHEYALYTSDEEEPF